VASDEDADVASDVGADEALEVAEALDEVALALDAVVAPPAALVDPAVSELEPQAAVIVSSTAQPAAATIRGDRFFNRMGGGSFRRAVTGAVDGDNAGWRRDSRTAR
jgi:hypothetical protein